MNPAAASGGASLRVHEALHRWAPAYRERFGTRMPARHLEVLDRILSCRTAARGGSLLYCPTCRTHHFLYHSCNDRQCPRCGQDDADSWLADHQHLLLPVGSFLVTFTVPEPLRRWMRSHPQRAYSLLFAASSQALQDLARNPKRLGARLGFLGILHTWSRTLLYHPHVHYLVPAGGLSPDGSQWIASRRKFLLPVRPLADRFRNCFRNQLEKEAPEDLASLPASIWKQRWVVHCASAGSGHNALRYLARYVFKTATANRPLPLLPDGRLRWSYRDSRTRQLRHVHLQPEEFLRRFLEHVLPAGFHRVRLFGWFHPAARVAFNRVRALLGQPAVLTAEERKAWLLTTEPAVAEPEPKLEKPLLCPRCRTPLKWIADWDAGQTPPQPPSRAPP